MANLFPGAIWRPMPGQEKRPRRTKGRGVGFHIAVSERSSIYDINLGTGNDAHLYVRRDGTVEQNIDLDLVAYAGAAGNSTMIWVETQGGTTAADVKTGRWDPAQAATLSRIARWAHDTEGVPLQLMPDSRPASRGIGTHRLGIQHSLGVGKVAGWLVVGGEKWSSALGKECPGDARIAQLPSIIAAAAGGTPQEDDMPLTVADAQLVAKTLMDWALVQRPNKLYSVGGMLIQLDDSLGVTKAAVDGVAKRVSQLEETAGSAPSGTIAPLNVDAGAVATALAGNQDFLSALARAVNDDAATRLAS